MGDPWQDLPPLFLNCECYPETIETNAAKVVAVERFLWEHCLS
jgi:hypothetical protein